MAKHDETAATSVQTSRKFIVFVEEYVGRFEEVC